VEGRCDILNDRDVFAVLYKNVFGKEIGKHPEVVYVGKTSDGVIGGFVAGHWEMGGTFFIEFAGVLPEFRNKGWLRYIKMLLDPCVEYMTMTENTNVTAMKTLLHTGFIPIGSRLWGGTFFIEWVRRGVKNGISG
jgi:hypothetical protein